MRYSRASGNINVKGRDKHETMCLQIFRKSRSHLIIILGARWVTCNTFECTQLLRATVQNLVARRPSARDFRTTILNPPTELLDYGFTGALSNTQQTWKSQGTRRRKPTAQSNGIDILGHRNKDSICCFGVALRFPFSPSSGVWIWALSTHFHPLPSLTMCGAILQPPRTFKSWYSTFRNRASYMLGRAHRYPPKTSFYIFFQQIYIQNFLNMLHTLRFFHFKMPFLS
jgi:hypothetical protein